jgi:hypothetical protein
VGSRVVCEADNLTVICQLSRQCRILNTSQLYGPPQADTGIALFFALNIYGHCHRTNYRDTMQELVRLRPSATVICVFHCRSWDTECHANYRHASQQM